MNKKTASLIIAAIVVFAVAAPRSSAQENSSSKPEPKPAAAYHLDFALNELEDGKKINTRQYAMDLIAIQMGQRGYPFSNRKDLKIGTRVPVETDQGKVEYLDIGTSIGCLAVIDEAGQLNLDTHAEVSSIVPRAPTDTYRPSLSNPILRQLSIESGTAITLGKLTPLGVVDDPDSKRQFQLEVTVSKLR